MKKQKFKPNIKTSSGGEKLYLETLVETGARFFNPSSQTGLKPSRWVEKFPYNDGKRAPENDFEEAIYEDFGGDIPVSIVDFVKALKVSRTRVNQILKSNRITRVWRGDNELSSFIFGDIKAGAKEYSKFRRDGLKKRAKAGAKARWSKTDVSSGNSK